MREQDPAAEVAATAPTAAASDRHEQGLGPDQPPRLPRGGADGAQQADLDLALGDGDADRGDDGEEHDQGAPPADDGAHDEQGLLVGGRDGAGAGRGQGRERAHQRGAEQHGHERRERGRGAVPQRGEGQPGHDATPATSSSRCAICPATASAVGRSMRPAIRPSTRKTTVSAYDAATGSWVTMTTV